MAVLGSPVSPALLTTLSCTALGWRGPQGQSQPREEGWGRAGHRLSLLCGQHLPTPPRALTPGPRVCSAPDKVSGLSPGHLALTLEAVAVRLPLRVHASRLFPGVLLPHRTSTSAPGRLPADLRRHWQTQKQSHLLTVSPAATIASGQSPVINPLATSPGGPASLIKASS